MVDSFFWRDPEVGTSPETAARSSMRLYVKGRERRLDVEDVHVDLLVSRVPCLQEVMQQEEPEAAPHYPEEKPQWASTSWEGAGSGGNWDDMTHGAGDGSWDAPAGAEDWSAPAGQSW